MTGQGRGIAGERPAFSGSQKLADPQHHVAGIGPPPPLAPLLELLGEIGRRLAAERRVGGTQALSAIAVAGGAGRETARAIAADIEERRRGDGRCGRPVGQGGIIGRHRLAAARVELTGDIAHLRMVAAPVGIGIELPLQIAGVEPGQPRRPGAVAAAVDRVAGEAGVRGAGPGAAERDDPAVRLEAVDRAGRGVGAARREPDASGDQRPEAGDRHAGSRTRRALRRFRRPGLIAALIRGLIPLGLLTGACKPPPEARQELPQASAARGRAVIARVGCGACHVIPGIGWPQGKVGPGLDGLAERGLIAGRLPNRPDMLAAYVRRAPALVPNSAMPAMPITKAEARDIAAYLYARGTS